MKIILSEPYKSLYPFESDELEDFSVIIGKNGSGKTQLLYMLMDTQRNADARETKVSINPPLKNLQSEGLINSNGGTINKSSFDAIFNRRISNIIPLSKNKKTLIELFIQNNWDLPINGFVKDRLLNAENETLEYLIDNIFREYYPKGGADPEDKEQIVLNNIFTGDFIQTLPFIREIREFTGKSITDISEADFYNTPFNEYLFDNNYLFASSIDTIFYAYAQRRDINRRQYFNKREDGAKNNAIPDDEFIRNFPPPWDLLNKILDDNKIKFKFPEIPKTDFHEKVSHQILPLKKDTKEKIQYGELSSGEKTIIGLILKLFSSEYYNQTLKLPDILLLDEPDAMLHPEMTSLLLNVLHKTFVNKLKIKVILTTHSPSTIALAPENSIYQLTNGINTSLKKITKDDALSLLTSFIPTLSINYKNHRQVFVESPTDVAFYQNLYNKHSQSQKCDFKLYFISNSPGKSNCQQVYSIVKSIRDSGNTTAFGLVDWDLNNQPSDFVYVHGFAERYSIENFILDPIYIICLLIELNNAHNILEDIGFDKTYNQYNLGQESSEIIQACFKFFFNKIESKFPAFKYDSERSSIEYLNGRKIEIPDFYLKTRGHDIVEKIKAVFSAIDGRYKNEGELQSKLTEIMCKCYPFVPLTSIKTIEAIANR
jgi:AAA15 family ATPase/GTPase